MRTSGAGRPAAGRATSELAMDQIFCLAPSINPPMEPVESSTKATSTRGRAPSAAGAPCPAAAAAITSAAALSIHR
jgi:hypothetical protein